MTDGRDLLRTRKRMVRDRATHIQRRQKTLEDANIKLDSVVTDLLGLSGRRTLEALIAGQTLPQALATPAHRRGPHGQVLVRGLDRRIHAFTERSTAKNRCNHLNHSSACMATMR
jgi:hypothetical protein